MKTWRQFCLRKKKKKKKQGKLVSAFEQEMNLLSSKCVKNIKKTCQIPPFLKIVK